MGTLLGVVSVPATAMSMVMMSSPSACACALCMRARTPSGHSQGRRSRAQAAHSGNRSEHLTRRLRQVRQPLRDLLWPLLGIGLRRVLKLPGGGGGGPPLAAPFAAASPEEDEDEDEDGPSVGAGSTRALASSPRPLIAVSAAAIDDTASFLWLSSIVRWEACCNLGAVGGGDASRRVRR